MPRIDARSGGCPASLGSGQVDAGDLTPAAGVRDTMIEGESGLLLCPLPARWSGPALLHPSAGTAPPAAGTFPREVARYR